MHRRIRGAPRGLKATSPELRREEVAATGGCAVAVAVACDLRTIVLMVGVRAAALRQSKGLVTANRLKR